FDVGMIQLLVKGLFAPVVVGQGGPVAKHRKPGRAPLLWVDVVPPGQTDQRRWWLMRQKPGQKRRVHAYDYFTMRALVLLAVLLPPPEAYTPAAADKVPGYYAELMPCKIVTDEGPQKVVCKGDLLERKTLRDLSILRNTIYARYGWDGYRKPWLREYFHSQPWFKANTKFTYKQLTEADRKNAHFVGVREQSFREDELQKMRDDIYAHHGKVWDDKPE